MLHLSILLCVGLVFVTLGPVGYRPSMTDDPQFDRFMALSIIGAVLAATFSRPLVVAARIAVIVIALEAGQYFVPGRHAQAADVVIKVAGALTGIGFVWALRHSLRLRSSTGAHWAATIVFTGTIIAVSTAYWYVVSPRLAIQNLRNALIAQHSQKLLSDEGLLFQLIPELNGSALRRQIIGSPEKALTTDIWGRSASTFSITIRTPDRKLVLLILRFQRIGLRWRLASIASPDGLT